MVFFFWQCFVCVFHRISQEEPSSHAKEECPPTDDNGIGVQTTNEQAIDTTFAVSGVHVAMFVPVVPVIVAFFQNKISHRHNPMAMMNYRNQRCQCVLVFVKPSQQIYAFFKQTQTHDLVQEEESDVDVLDEAGVFLHGCVCCAFFFRSPSHNVTNH